MNLKMKLKNKLTYAFGLIVLSINCSSAAVIVQETFEYPDGNLNGQDGGIGFTAPWVVTTASSNNRLSTVQNEALFSNPNGSNGTNDDNASTAERAFTGFDSDIIQLELDYNLITDSEGVYQFNFTLLDTTGQEVFTAGITNDTYSVTFANGQSVSQNVNNSPFDDTLVINLDLSSAISLLAVESSLPSLNTSGTPLTSNTSFDFSGGGQIQVSSLSLDQNQISIDNITLSIPEPSTFILGISTVLFGLFQRKRS